MGWLVSDDGDERDARLERNAYKYGGSRTSGGASPAKTQEQIAEEEREASRRRAAALFPITKLRGVEGKAIKVDGLTFRIVVEENRVLLQDGKATRANGIAILFPADGLLYDVGAGWTHVPRRGGEELGAVINALRSYVGPV